MQATLENNASRPRRGWALVTTPPDLATTVGAECTFQTLDGRRFRAVRASGKTKRGVFRVFVELGPHECVTGSFVAEAHEDATRFDPHPWVGDNVQALLPHVGVRISEGLTIREYWAEDYTSIDLIEQSPAHQRWRVVQHIHDIGVVFTWWADVHHMDPVIRVRGKVIWSDRKDARPNRLFDAIAIRSGERVAFDFRRRIGMPQPAQDYDGRWVHNLLTQPVSLQDGAGIAFSGVMLSMRDPVFGTRPADPTVEEPDLRNLQAAAEAGVMKGVSHNWAGRWLAGRFLPRLAASGAVLSGLADVFATDEDVATGLLALRPLGSLEDPGSTGDQEDFGATKGTEAVVLHRPSWIEALAYSMHAEALRGVNLHEGNGTMLRAASHPQWVTWSGRTHYHPGVSPDRIGKVTAVVPAGTGWSPHDDQHRSHNNLAAFIQLTDDPWAEEHVAFQAEIDAAAYYVRYTNMGYDAARAQGRTAQALAQLIAVTENAGTETKLRAILATRIGAIVTNPTVTADRPMRVLAWGMPDQRKNVRTPDGNLGRWVSLWEHGLALVGLFEAYKVQPSFALNQTLIAVATTLATHGFFESGDGRWYSVADILWADGAAVPLAPGSPALVAEIGIGGVLGWMFAGVLAAREILGPDSPHRARLTSYINWVTSQRDAADLRTAEWWAIVESVVPV